MTISHPEVPFPGQRPPVIGRLKDLAVVPKAKPSMAPDRFEAYDPEIKQRAFELWSGICGRHGTRTLRMLRRELGEDISLPTAPTIRRWAIDDAWHARADSDLAESHGRTLYELQVGWLAGLKLAQATLLDAMTGAFDDLPFGGAGRLKAAEVTLRTIERAGLLAILPQPPQDVQAVDWQSLSPDEQQALARDLIQQRKAGGTREPPR